MRKMQLQTTHRNLPRQAAPEPHPRLEPTADRVGRGLVTEDARGSAPSAASNDTNWERRVFDAAREYAQYAASHRSGRKPNEELARIIGKQASVWFPKAFEGFDRLTTLEPGTAKYEKAKAFDALISVEMRWRYECPYYHTYVLWQLHGLMCACEAPLPRELDSVRREIRRIKKRLKDALNPKSAMSAGWRRHWRGSYPVTAITLKELGHLPVGKQRIARFCSGDKSMPKKAAPI